MKIEYLKSETRDLLLEFRNKKFLEDFVLVSGSGLALYLGHRISTDLDFFTYKKIANFKSRVKEFVKEYQGVVTSESEEQIDSEIFSVKVTFFNAGWSFLTPKDLKNLNVADLKALSAMKIHALFLRATYRDYYDLYYISKEKGFRILLEASKLIPNLNSSLVIRALTYTDDISDIDISHLEPRIQLPKEDIKSYFEKEIKKFFNKAKRI